MKKRRYSGLLMVLALVLVFGMLVLGGCDSATPPVDDDDDDNGDDANGTPGPLKTLTVTLNSTPPTLDLHNHRNRNAQTLARNWTDSLVQTMYGEGMVLDIATEVTQLDGKTFEIKLRRDVTFHNGDPMTADDVVFSLTRVGMEGGLEGETSPRRTLVGNPVRVEKIDDYTMVVELAQERSLDRYLGALYNTEIIPKDYFLEVGPDKFFEHPIGVGPFKFVEGDLSTQIVLERYENYYGGVPEMHGEVDRIPALDRVIFTFIPEASTRVAALLAGDVDIITHVAIDSIALLEANPATRVESVPGSVVSYLALNTNKAPFDDKRVRQGIAYAIDYDLISQKLHLGFSDPLYGNPLLLPYEGTPGYGEFDNIEGYQFNPEKARELLEEAGVTGYATIIDTSAQYAEEAQVVAQMLSDVGIDASVRVWDAAVIIEETRKGQRDIYLGSMGVGVRGTHEIYKLIDLGSPLNYAQLNHPELINLMAEAVKMDERDPVRHEMIRQAVDIFIDEAPFVILFGARVIEACRSHVKNFYPSGRGRLNLHRVDLEVQ